MTPTPTPTPAARVSGTIKALEWDGDYRSGDAGSAVGRYVYQPVSGFCHEWKEWVLFFDGVEMSRHPTIAAAKAAAQADYEARILAAIQPDPEPQPVAWRYRSLDGTTGWTSATEFRRSEYARIGMEEQPLYATPSSAGSLNIGNTDSHSPSSAGTVSVEAAAKVLLAKCPNPIFDQLKPVLMGEVTERVGYTDEDGNEAYYDRPVSWDAMKTIIRAALRVLAGEGGR